MKLRTKAILFFGSLLIFVILVMFFYGQYIVGNTYKNQTTNDLRIFAEQSEGAYFTFLKGLKGRVIDWSLDPTIQHITENLLLTEVDSSERNKFAKDFSNYITEKRMSYDKTVFLADIIDKNGIVIASTNPKRVGINEGKEEINNNVSFFSKTIKSELGEAFVKSVVFEEDETTEPMSHATARIFKQNNKGEFIPLDAVLMLHFLNIKQIADVLSGEGQLQEGAKTGKALLASYESSEIYLVNSDQIMVTPSRFVKDIKIKQKVDTLPVRECLENKKEIISEYEDYMGIRVLGASMCFESEGLVLLVEVNKDEIFSPINHLMKVTFFFLGILFILGAVLIMLFVRRPIQRFNKITMALDQVKNGDFNTEVKVDMKDEIGSLAIMFNNMISTIRKDRELMQESKNKIEESEIVLKKNLEEHEMQEKFLGDSKKAMINLLEDSWEIKEKLKEEGNKLQTILASIGDGLILIDNKYKIALVNAKVIEIFKMPLEEIISKDLRDIAKLYKNKTYIEPELWPIEDVFLKNESITSTTEDNFGLITKGREAELPISFTIAPIKGVFSGAVIIIRNAISDRELDDAKTGFISTASHQLRTPLTSMRWFSEMLLDGDAGKINEEQKQFVNRIYNGTMRMISLVELLLQTARVESGRIKNEPILVDLKIITEEVEATLKVDFENKKQKININTKKIDSSNIFIDKEMLWQVIQNLLSNANRYSSIGSTIFVNIIKKDGEVEYSVKDSGIGIPKDQQSRLFEKFFRADNAISAVPEGSGLGLSLIKNIVESWGGKTWFESEEGKGSIFFFTIPINKNLITEKTKKINNK